MSDDSQLTVAELLSRAQKENPGAEQPRRRRRRSLDEGGVSVAELTGSLRKVEARPVESKHSSVPIDPVEPEPVKPIEAVEPEPVDASETTVIKKVEVETKPAAAATTTTTWSKFERSAQEPAEVTGEITVVADAPAPAPAPVYDESVYAEQPEFLPEAEAEAEAAVNPIMLVLFVFLGLIAGVLGFIAFQWVWANLPLAVALILALVVTAAVVFGVRAMRTGKDGLTMTLAGLAALVVTLGPGLISGL
ncbi:hypothetical protein M3G47_02725 [Corynebacterium sanguinis]|uniref:Uncharacterized protein n=1 Tax=Corynebacterium sanguinis TaxID=2594913 RepID=A0A6C1TZ45_9CORY|nr:hypothetical protein [Corynebacterium sanguinis]MCT1491813.1 hypothetical protein [Corynebacterium sanguinis]MCT2247009.1 hypothetical protein [Corynebacterium sanguinis]TVS29411.1 hypothetical protein EKI59_03670 [Corynebacterium sanguinis]